jgi:hypothetical protein
MKEMDKLRILIPHWIEHNQDHADEFRKWAIQAGEAAPDILAAADQMNQVNKTLESALAKLGGPLEYHHEH